MNSELITPAELNQNGPHWAAKAATIMRGAGASILIGAISLFLLQGWDNGNDLSRFYLLMGHSILLAAIGFTSHLWMGESKGARLLLMICALSIPASFAIMGGFLYGHFPWDITNAAYPNFTFWKTNNPREAITACIGMLAVATALMWLCFKVLARRSAKTLTGIYLVTNSLLLTPLRDHYSLGMIIPLAALATLWAIHKARTQDATLKTKEGLICQLLVLSPLLLMAARSFWLYEPSAVFFAGLSTMAFILCRQIDVSITHSSTRKLLLSASILSAMLASGASVTALNSVFTISFGLLIALFTWLLAIFMTELSMRDKPHQSTYRAAIALLIGVGAIATTVIDNHFFGILISFLMGAAIIVGGIFAQQKSIFIIGIITALFGLYGLFSQLLFNFDFTRWSSLAAIGITSILIGSIIENKSKDIKRIAQSFNHWSY